MPSAIDETKMQAKQQGNQSFDITTPPLKPIPFQEYPKVMYLWPKDKSLHPLHDSISLKDEKGRILRDDEGEVISEVDFQHSAKKRVKTVNNREEEEALRAKGFRDKPHVQQLPDQVEIDPEADISHLERSKKAN